MENLPKSNSGVKCKVSYSPKNPESWEADVRRMQARKEKSDRIACEREAGSRPPRGPRRKPKAKQQDLPIPQERFGMPLARVLENPEISATARLAYSIMACSTDARTGVCKLAMPEIARRVGMTRRRVIPHVHELERRGIVGRLSRHGQSAVWRVKIGGRGVVDNSELMTPASRVDGELMTPASRVDGELMTPASPYTEKDLQSKGPVDVRPAPREGESGLNREDVTTEQSGETETDEQLRLRTFAALQGGGKDEGQEAEKQSQNADQNMGGKEVCQTG